VRTEANAPVALEVSGIDAGVGGEAAVDVCGRDSDCVGEAGVLEAGGEGGLVLPFGHCGCVLAWWVLDIL
jgi:hypothetical protein